MKVLDDRAQKSGYGQERGLKAHFGQLVSTLYSSTAG
jgi:hypothetical protein